MVKVYADLVEAGERSLDGADGIKQVPEKYLQETFNVLVERKFIEKPEILL